MNNLPEPTQNLIALLDDHQDEIADAWLKAIHRQMPESAYSQRPPEEIRANNLSALAMLKDLLLETPPDTVWQRHAVPEVSAQYIGLGIDVSEFVMAALGIRSMLEIPFVVRDRVQAVAMAPAAEREL